MPGHDCGRSVIGSTLIDKRLVRLEHGAGIGAHLQPLGPLAPPEVMAAMAGAAYVRDAGAIHRSRRQPRSFRQVWDRARIRRIRMKVYSLLIAFIWGLILILAALNWAQFSASSNLSVIVMHVQWPLGIVLLAAMLLVTVVFLTLVVHLQAGAHLQSRRHADLRSQVETALTAQAQMLTLLRTDLLAELQQQGARIHTELEHSGNTLAAYIGELEDRLDRNAGPSVHP